MRHSFMTDDDVIAAATTGRLDADAVYAFCRSRAVTFPDFSNALSLRIARRFDQSSMSYDDADAAMNAIWQTMIHYVTRQEPDAKIWEPTYSIYCAFDAGEYDHGDGKDPVEQFTKPAVKAILSAA